MSKERGRKRGREEKGKEREGREMEKIGKREREREMETNKQQTYGIPLHP